MHFINKKKNKNTYIHIVCELSTKIENIEASFHLAATASSCQIDKLSG